MNKSRKGGALVMALVVILVGSSMIGIIFNVVFRQAWFAPHERAGFIDHTTVFDALQTARNSILETNLANEETTAAPITTANWNNPPAANAPNIVPGALIANQQCLVIFREEFAVADGSGRGLVRVTVFDMFYDPAWLNWNDPDFDINELPPSILVMAEPGGGWGPFDDDGGGGGGGGGGSITPGTPQNPGAPPDNIIDPELFGAYLVRVELFDQQNRIVRVAEEAFFQLLEEQP